MFCKNRSVYLVLFSMLLILHASVYAVDVNKKLSDLIPGTKSIPFLKDVIVKKVINKDDSIEVIGQLKGKAITISKSYKVKKSFTVTGADIKLSDVIPQTKNVKFLQEFALDKIEHTPEFIEVDGKINGRSISINEPSHKKSFTITGDDIKLDDIISSTKNIKFLQKFALDKIIHTPSLLSVEGKIDGKFISVVKTLKTKTLTITGANIQLSDIISQTKKLKFLQKFKLDKIVHTSSTLSVDGKIDSKDVSITKTLTKKNTPQTEKSFTLTGADIEISDIFDVTKNISFLDKFKFDKLEMDSKKIEVDGKIGS